ncbi:MAG: hypothetical protein GX568_04155 [Candidatus Gastranaerophilales bacterium]|nr:hypothetical protein [Candidatus Gastranaerophilales bacterium]
MSLNSLQTCQMHVVSANDKKKNISFADNTSNQGMSSKDTHDLRKEPEHHGDKLVSNNPVVKFKESVKQTSKLPKYAVEGLKGDPNANFYEFNRLAAIPYWVGGGVLTLIFMAGGKEAKNFTKSKFAGIVAYYALAGLAKAAVDIPAKLFKGVDLNQKYIKTVHLKPDANNRNPKPKTELHNVLESKDFTRFDLLENQSRHVAANPALVNERYDRLARSMGYNKDLEDSDSTVRPYIRNVIATSRAWKSALIIPLAAVAASISATKTWGSAGQGFKKNWWTFVSDKTKISQKIMGLGRMTNTYLLKPIGASLKEVWKGSIDQKGFAKHVGKVGLIASGAAILLANINMLRITKPDKDTPLRYDESQYKKIPVTHGSQPAASSVDSRNTGYRDFAENVGTVHLYNPKKNEYII